MDDTARLARLAQRAAAEIEDGMTVGLGSGSTAEAVVRALGERVAAGLSVRGVPTSQRTERLARSLDIPLLSLDEVDHLDLGFDGADEIDPALNLVKGRGGALLYEKLVALACDRYLIVAAAEKLVSRLGTRLPLPVEVVPFGWQLTAARLEALGCRPSRRLAADGSPFLTDGGHFVLDCATGPIADAPTLAAAIKPLTGVVDHGLFIDLASQALVAHPDGAIELFDRTRNPPPPATTADR